MSARRRHARRPHVRPWSVKPPRVAVVVPAYRVARFILNVLARIGPEVRDIYVIDDACPDHSGALVKKSCRDPRVHVLRNRRNLGVGGAVLVGYGAAIHDGADIIVKIDGDGQIDPALIPRFIAPILAGQADYTKGNRFCEPEALDAMPPVRTVGNAVLALMAKASTGYWDIMDPTNGLTCIHARVARRLPFTKISRRYFFESDMLFRLNRLQAVVQDVPMVSVYGAERSSMHLRWIVPEFLFKHALNFTKRMVHVHVLRDVSKNAPTKPIHPKL